MKFHDQARIYIKSGAGGAGCQSFRREAFVEFGGPDGGDGGRGGHIYAEAVHGLNTLVDYRYAQHHKAKTGQHGMGRDRTGKAGEDLVLKVPVGTQIFDESQEFMIADLMEEGQRVLLARGGEGGLGNAHFKSSTNRAPRRTTPGGPAEEMTIWLRLKLIADAGLVGLPNAGKSTFLSAATRARPKIADYPFTTLSPNLGVVYRHGGEFVIADIPGLIEGASEGVGLGTRFLGHVERTRILLHLVDGSSDDIETDFKTIRHELEQYDGGLLDKPTIVGLNKCDLLDDEEIAEKKALLEELSGQEVFVLSAAGQLHLDPVLDKMSYTVLDAKKAELDAKEQEEAEKEAQQRLDEGADSTWSPV